MSLHNLMTLLSFGFSLLMFVLIGLLSVLRREQTGVDYLLASHSVKPWLVGLSAIATNNSGYMFIGMIGFTYTYGMSSIWLMVGWIVGDFLTSLATLPLIGRASPVQSNESPGRSPWFPVPCGRARQPQLGSRTGR